MNSQDYDAIIEQVIASKNETFGVKAFAELGFSGRQLFYRYLDRVRARRINEIFEKSTVMTKQELLDELVRCRDRFATRITSDPKKITKKDLFIVLEQIKSLIETMGDDEGECHE